MANVATLTLKGTSDLRTIATDLRSVGTESQKAGTSLKTVTTELDKGSKSATSFGQKVKSFGSTFSSSIASIGTLGGTVLNLSRQYQDLDDSQIRVDRSQLKVSKTTEAVGVAQGKLNDLTAKGVTSGAEYDAALLNVKQALEAQDLAERNLKEAQEDHQRAQENFWIGLVPTVTSAGASIVSVLNDIGGTKGIGGLKTALAGLKGAFSVFTGAGGLASGIAGIGTAASGSVGGLNGMATATTGLGGAMKQTALSMLPVALALGGVALATKAAGMVIHEIISIMKGDMLEAVKSIQSLIDFYTKIGSVVPMGAGFAIFTALKPEVAKLRAELEKVPQAIKPVSAELQGMDNIGKGMSGTIDNLIGGVLGLTQKADSATPALNNTGGAIAGIGTSATGAQPPIEGLSSTITTFVGGNVGLLDALSQSGVAMGTTAAAADPLASAIAAVGAAADAANAPLAALTKNAQANATAAQNAGRRNLEMAAAIAKATQSMQKQAQVASKGGGGGGAPPVHFIGGPVKGARNPNFRLRSDWKKATIIKAQHGMHETVNSPTWILAGEAGRERVDIGKPGSGGGGGGTTIVNVYVDGVQRPARYSIGTRK